MKPTTSRSTFPPLDAAVAQLAALAHPGRLQLTRALIQAGDDGIAAGDLARSAGLAATTASAQLLVLKNAGLVTSERQGRSIRYFAAFEAMCGLLGYLMADCCGGRSEICQPLAALTGRGEGP